MIHIDKCRIEYPLHLKLLIQSWGEEIAGGENPSRVRNVQKKLPQTTRGLMRPDHYFVPAGQSTQMVIGASDESDYQIISVSEALYCTLSRFMLPDGSNSVVVVLQTGITFLHLCHLVIIGFLIQIHPAFHTRYPVKLAALPNSIL